MCIRDRFLSSIGLTLLVQLGLWWLTHKTPGLLALGSLLFVFFYAFNVLEASQPSMVSRQAPANARVAAIGVYNTRQSLGFFAGGLGGGWLVKHGGAQALFAACAGLMLLWLLVAWPMPVSYTHLDVYKRQDPPRRAVVVCWTGPDIVNLRRESSKRAQRSRRRDELISRWAEATP